MLNLCVNASCCILFSLLIHDLTTSNTSILPNDVTSTQPASQPDQNLPVHPILCPTQALYSILVIIEVIPASMLEQAVSRSTCMTGRHNSWGGARLKSRSFQQQARQYLPVETAELNKPMIFLDFSITSLVRTISSLVSLHLWIAFSTYTCNWELILH
jgi:hypothetical protein